MSNQQISIACDMNALPDCERHLQVRQTLMPQAVAIVELETGFQVSYPVNTLPLVAEFVDGERRCCPFIHFAISISPASKTVELRISGGNGVKKFLRHEFLPNLPELHD